MKIEYTPIGVIHSPFTELQGMPIQPSGADGVMGTVEVFQEFHAGLKDLTGFSHIVLLYHFHRSQGFKLHVAPSWILKRKGCLPHEPPNDTIRSGSQSSASTALKAAYLTSRTWTFSTAPHFWTSSRMWLNLMPTRTFGQAGLKKPEGPCRIVNPMIDSDRNANKPIKARGYRVACMGSARPLKKGNSDGEN